MAVAPGRPVVRADVLVEGGSTAGARRQEALRLARLQAEEEVRRGVLVDAGAAVTALVPADRAAGGLAPRPGRLRARCAKQMRFLAR